MSAYSPVIMNREEAIAFIISQLMEADDSKLEDVADLFLSDSVQYLDINHANVS